MGIKITQSCNNCGEERDLDKFGNIGEPRTLAELANAEGWREVRPNKHLCKDCINDMVR